MPDVIGAQLAQSIKAMSVEEWEFLLRNLGFRPSEEVTVGVESIKPRRLLANDERIEHLELMISVGKVTMEELESKMSSKANAIHPASNSGIPIQPPLGNTDTIEGSNKYDAFISYRRIERDQKFARELTEKLESAGYVVAIDERDFVANETFLDEMERCTRESRFTLAIITPEYFESGNTDEEAIIRKVQDMAQKKRGLIPVYLERPDKEALPYWLYDVVGVDFTAESPMIPPIQKLIQALAAPEKS